MDAQVGSALVRAFDFEGREFRVLGSPEAPEFVARDVCDALGLVKVSRALAGLPAAEKGAQEVSTPGGPQRLSTVTEAGLYRLIFRSDKPNAERLRAWVFGSVLPTIRRTGGYGAPAGLLERVAFLERALLDAIHNGRLATETSSQAMGCVAQALALHGRAKAVQEAALGAVEAGQRMLIPGAEPLPVLGERRRVPPTREQVAALLSAIEALDPAPLTAREILERAAMSDSAPVAAAFAPFGGRSLRPGPLGNLLGRIHGASFDGLSIVRANGRRPWKWRVGADRALLPGADAVPTADAVTS